MIIQISTRHFRPSSDIRKRVRELCEDVVQHVPDVLRIHVVLDDTSGSDITGPGIRCHFTVRGRNHLRIDVSEYQGDIWQSIDGAYRQLAAGLERHRRQESEENSAVVGATMPVCDDVLTGRKVTVGPWTVYSAYIEEGCSHE